MLWDRVEGVLAAVQGLSRGECHGNKTTVHLSGLPRGGVG
jgi:hypothetical protein